MSKIILTVVIVISFLFWQCNGNTKASIPYQNSSVKEDFRKALSDRITSIDSLDLLYHLLKDNLELIKSFYSSIEYQPVIIIDFNAKDKVDSILYFFEKANEHGITPKIYNSELIKSEFEKSSDTKLDLKQRYYHLSNTELILANSLINYSLHLRQGFVNPNKLFSPDYEIPSKRLTSSEIIEPLQQSSVTDYLKKIQPSSERYVRLQQALKNFNNLLDQEWNPIPPLNSKIEQGNKYQFINQIVKRLIILGFIDTNKTKIETYSKYENFLVEPIKQFQRSHGLIDDGVIGKGTIERFNITPTEYVEKIKLNLERFRWNDYSDTSKYILVNIPDFKLKGIENKEKIIEIKVCTGRKVKWQTPVLYSQLSYLVLNPTWNVPQSIVQEEIIDGLKKDSLYLIKRNFKAYKSGKEVSLEEINIEELKTKRYTLVQNPGAGNALGKIKFMFDNPFGVYLHDTPTRAPFNYVNRAVSHGCVRVEKPYLLAEFLLKDNSDWIVDYVKIETGYNISDKKLINQFQSIRNKLRKNYSYGETTEVRLFNRIPLFIDYFTTWVDEDGILNYREDVYEKDKLLKKHLNFL